MTLVDSLKPKLHRIRAIPGQLGLRPHSVALVTVPRDGVHTGDGARDETLTPITEFGGYSPKVRWAKAEDVAMGLVPKGFVTIGPITPELGAELEVLQAIDLTTGDVRKLRITGPQHPNGGDYTITDVRAERSMRYVITALSTDSQAL